MRGIQADIRGDELGDEIAFFYLFLYNFKKYGHKKSPISAEIRLLTAKCC